jgi:tRNA (adenine57-N1/adenine58-N1)-methyltransferase
MGDTIDGVEGPLNTAQAGDLAMLVAHDHKHFILRLEPAAALQTHRGVVSHDSMIGSPWGSMIQSHLGSRFYLVQPSLHDILLGIRRSSQIIFPKDLGYILLRLSIGPGKTVIEAGTGSGALTTALAWAVGPGGKVISYDRRADMQELALRNLSRVGLESRVVLKQRDIEQGFDETDVDALFLDLPTPHLFLGQARAALRGGGAFGAILPTTPQVSALLQAMEVEPFAFIEVCELMLRHYKPIAERLRPTDRMVAHTGYLVFARPVSSPPDFDLSAALDEGTLPADG